MTKDRKKRRWIRFKKRKKTLSFIANQLLGQPNRRTRKKLRSKGQRWKKAVVVVGDGNWRTRRGGRGRTIFPRKQLVRAIAHQGICIVMDEYHTSKNCPNPGCGGTLKDVHREGHGRYRCCSNETCLIHNNYIERDVSGAWSIWQCGQAFLFGEPRPTHYCRKN